MRAASSPMSLIATCGIVEVAGVLSVMKLVTPLRTEIEVMDNVDTNGMRARQTLTLRESTARRKRIAAVCRQFWVI